MTWHGGVKAAWTSALFNAQTQVADGVSKIKLPFITIHGTSDRMVDIASSQFLYDNAQSEDKTFEVCIYIILCFSSYNVFPHVFKWRNFPRYQVCRAAPVPGICINFGPIPNGIGISQVCYTSTKSVVCALLTMK